MWRRVAAFHYPLVISLHFCLPYSVIFPTLSLPSTQQHPRLITISLWHPLLAFWQLNWQNECLAPYVITAVMGPHGGGWRSRGLRVSSRRGKKKTYRKDQKSALISNLPFYLYLMWKHKRTRVGFKAEWSPTLLALSFYLKLNHCTEMIDIQAVI